MSVGLSLKVFFVTLLDAENVTRCFLSGCSWIQRFYLALFVVQTCEQSCRHVKDSSDKLSQSKTNNGFTSKAVISIHLA